MYNSALLESHNCKDNTIEDMVKGLISNNPQNLSDIECNGLRGLGIHSDSHNSYINEPEDVDTFNIILDPFILGRGTFQRINPELERTTEGIILMYFNSFKLEHFHPIFKEIKRKYWIVGPIIERKTFLGYQSLWLKSVKKEKPSFELITSETKYIPFYEKDINNLKEFLEKYKRTDLSGE